MGPDRMPAGGAFAAIEADGVVLIAGGKDKPASPATEPSTESLIEIQRARLVGAATEVLELSGYGRFTVTEIVARARVSRKTFYDVFKNSEDCFCAVVDHLIGDAAASVQEAYAGAGAWPDRLRKAMREFLRLVDEHPGSAQICLVEVLASKQATLRCRAPVLEQLAYAVSEGGATDTELAPGLAELAAQVVVGGVAGMLHDRLARGDREPVEDLLGPAMYLLLLPYRGREEAEAELVKSERNAVHGKSARRSRDPREDPLGNLEIRLTYRTLRVLAAIHTTPGASNREVAHGAGIVDAGQISKLLNRLRKAALVENQGIGQLRGGANAWHLTGRGKQLLRASYPSSRLVTSARATS